MSQRVISPADRLEIVELDHAGHVAATYISDSDSTSTQNETIYVDVRCCNSPVSRITTQPKVDSNHGEKCVEMALDRLLACWVPSQRHSRLLRVLPGTSSTT